MDQNFIDMEFQNGFEATLDARVVNTDTYIPMTPVPEGDFGRLVLEDTSKENFEIIRYNRKDAAGVYVEVADGGLRNEDGSSSGIHPRGARVRGNLTAQDLREWKQSIINLHQSFITNQLATIDWRPITAVPTVQSIDGFKNVTLRYPGVNLTSVLPTDGGKLRAPRSVAAPTQVFDFTRSQNQRAVKTAPAGVNITDDFTAMGWVNLRSLPNGAAMSIISAYNATGWIFRITSGGHVNIYVQNGTGIREANSYRVVPVGDWVHVAASMDASAGVAKIWVNGEEVPYVLTGAATSITPAGSLMLGNWGLANILDGFDGQMDDVRVYNSLLTQQQVIDSMNSYPAANTGMIAWFKSGSWNDASANGNTLVPAGTTNPTNNYTAAGHPWKDVEYGRIKAVAYNAGSNYTDVTVFAGVSNIPKATLLATSYSTMENPIGYPKDTDILAKAKIRVTSGDATLGTANWASVSGATKMRLRGPILQDGYGLNVSQTTDVITIGAGIRRIRVNFSAMFDGATGTYLYARMQKNGADIDQVLVPLAAGFAGASSPMEYIDVVQGDTLSFITDINGNCRAFWSQAVVEVVR